ncbi:MAG: transketolase [Flavobacteriaceae bacterium]|nr:transketolase [Flavobacteriaceae bacterium]MCY4266682.1 transketolase [Flavobacteriaceae bacterium]MCY4299731.1 transketolase [Flavobacteriaceae bacterium]
MPKPHHLDEKVIQTRRDIVRMVHGAKSGHPGGSLGCTEFLITLFQNHMNYQLPFDMDGIGQDLFFLSNGHISPVFYSVLARSGFFSIKELSTFRKINSRLQGHPTTHEGLPGVRVASGSLGQGLSVAVGAALSKKLNQDSTLVYALLGDGELQEGQNWEAIMFAGGNDVDNLIVTVDYNGQQIDGATQDVLPLGNLENKFQSFGWQVLTNNRGNDLYSVKEGLENALKVAHKSKPIVIIMKTEMGNGVDFMMHSHQWHGIAPNDQQLQSALDQNPTTSLGDY